MYSLVLMMAMSNGAAAAPGWQGGEVDSRGTNFIHATAHEHARHGCHGCRGGGYGGCYGGGCYGGGCYGGGYSCCGCCGGGGWGGCYGGGYGGCYGGGYGGCYGGGYGGCYGGGYGGCYGGGCGGGYAAASYSMPYASYGMPYGSYAGMPAYGGYSSGYYTPAPADTGIAPVPGGGRGVEEKDRGGERGPADRGRERDRDEDRSRESLAPTPATLIVTLPADAKLMIDGYTARSNAGTRTFVSPPLTPGEDYHYTLKAELRRGDEPVTVSKDVTVRAGQETRVTLDFAGASVAKR
jgi:uncharacterized protein (TIGR03000 family)